ncbi:MAG: transporter substrate-binding domain-containing protein [Chloroflexi bacterium]|nr:transporter substrate-binding domain-containing protein [Chloroflexota bacterium]
MKRLVFTCIALLIVVTIVACAAPTSAPAPTAAPAAGGMPDLKGRALKVGSDTTYPPFESVDKDKKIVGFDVELVDEICKKVNCKATFNTADFDGLMVAVNNKTYDFSVSGWTITDERAKAVDFGLAYMPNTEVLLVRADEARIKEPEDLKKPEFIVAVQLGTTNAITAKKLVADGNKQVKEFQDFPAAVQALLNKQADAVVIDTFAASQLLEDNKGKIKLTGKQFGESFLGFVFRKGDAELKNAFDAGLKAVYKDGTWGKLCEKWWKGIQPQPDCAGKLLSDKLGK